MLDDNDDAGRSHISDTSSARFLDEIFGMARRLDELHTKNTINLEKEITALRFELERRDSPESIAILRDKMHHFRRQCEDVLSPKLKEAEAFIAKQEKAIESNRQTISDLVKRCRELEQTEPCERP